LDIPYQKRDWEGKKIKPGSEEEIRTYAFQLNKKTSLRISIDLDECWIYIGNYHKRTSIISFGPISHIDYLAGEKKVVLESYQGSKVNFIEINSDGTFNLYLGFIKKHYQPNWHKK
jgi:hypothetical protein